MSKKRKGRGKQPQAASGKNREPVNVPATSQRVDIKTLKAAVENEPAAIGPRLVLGEHYVRTGAEAEAVTVLEALENKYPFENHLESKIYDRLLALAYVHVNRFNDTERVCERGLEAEPEGIDFLWVLTYVHLSMREYDRAIECGRRYLDFVQQEPAAASDLADYTRSASHASQAANFVGSAYFEKASWDDAVAYFEMSVKADPGNHLPYINLVNLAKHHKDIEGARRTTEQGLKQCRQVQELRMLQSTLQASATVSACMIVKDEEKLLPECLDSIRDWVDEIIIVDTGSTDGTVEIAESYGAKVFHQPWEGNFSKHRNYSLDQATCDWIFIIDADERFEMKDLAALRRFINQDDVDIISINVFNVYGDQEELTTFLPSVRFWRRQVGLRYEGIVHNLLKLGEEHPVLRTNISIKHLGYGLELETMKKKYIRTKTLLEKQLEENPDNFFALFNYAQLLKGEKVDYPDKDIETIIKSASRAVELTDHGDKAERHIHLMCLDQIAWAHFFAGRWDEAMEFCDRALGLKPDYLDALMLKGHLYARKEMWDEAYDAYQCYLDVQRAYNLETEKDCLILTHVDNRASALYGQALIWDIRKNKEEAKRFYLETLKEQPSYLEANLRLASIYLDEGAFSEAAKHYDRQLAATPDSEDAAIGLATAQRRLGNYESAEKNYRRAIESNPDRPHLHLTFGRFLHEIGRNDEATEQFRLAVEKGAGSVQLHAQMAETYMLMEQYEDAIASYQTAVDQQGPSAELVNDIGNCYFKMKQYEPAEEYYLKAIELDSGLALAYRNLGLTQTGLEKYDEALISLEKYSQLDGDDADVLPIIGDIYAKTGQHERALTFYERYLTQNPSAIHILYRLSDCYLNMGHTDSAILGFRRVLQLSPDFEPAQRRLDSLTGQALIS